MAVNHTMGLTDLSKAVKMIKKEEIEVFSSKVIHAQTKTIFWGINMHVMMQTLEGVDGPCLPNSLNVMNICTEMTTRSKRVVVVVKNLTAAPIIIAKGIKVAEVVAGNVVPQMEVVLGTLEKLDEIQDIWQTRMSGEQRREMLFQQVELSGLEGWSDKNQAATKVLLAEYHDIFSLEPGELGCTDLAKNEI